jgi:hypothetical protein
VDDQDSADGQTVGGGDDVSENPGMTPGFSCAFQRYNARMRVPNRRRTLWLSAALLVAVLIGAWLLVPRSRITQENFDRIHVGMSVEEVTAILGDSELVHDEQVGDRRTKIWRSGPKGIAVGFYGEIVEDKHGSLPGPWATVRWYAKKGAEKIGVK